MKKIAIVLLGLFGETIRKAYAPYCSFDNCPFSMILPLSALIEQESIVTSLFKKTSTTTTFVSFNAIPIPTLLKLSLKILSQCS